MTNELESPSTDAVGIAEKAAIPSKPSEKEYSGLLTDAEWAEVLPPFYYAKVNFDQWGDIEHSIALKRALKNATGWVYYSNHRYIFGSEEDYVLFRMWAENKPMNEKDSSLFVT